MNRVFTFVHLLSFLSSDKTRQHQSSMYNVVRSPFILFFHLRYVWLCLLCITATASIIIPPQNQNKGNNCTSHHHWYYWCWGWDVCYPLEVLKYVTSTSSQSSASSCNTLVFRYQSGFLLLLPRPPFFLMSFSFQGKSYLIIFTFTEWKQLVSKVWVIIVCTCVYRI